MRKRVNALYSKVLAKIIRVIECILMVLLAAALIIITLQVLFRYILAAPLNWSEQTARCLFIWMIMLAVPVLFYRKGAVAFDLLVDMMPRKAQDVLKIIVELLVLGFAVFYLITSIQLCIQTGSRILSGIEIPMNLLYSAPPVAMIITILVVIPQIAACVTDLVKKEDK